MQEAVKQPNLDDYRNEDGYDWDAFHIAQGEYSRWHKTQRLEKRLFQEMSIDEELWATTPQKIKDVVVDLFDECDNLAGSLEEVRNWAEDIPI